MPVGPQPRTAAHRLQRAVLPALPADAKRDGAVPLSRDEEGGKGAGVQRSSVHCARARPLAPPEAGMSVSAALLPCGGAVWCGVVPAAAQPKPILKVLSCAVQSALAVTTA